MAKRVQAYYARKNLLMRDVVEPFLECSAAGGCLSVALPFPFVLGAFEALGFVTVEQGGRERTLVMEMTAVFASPDGASHVELKGITVENAVTPCGREPAHVFPLPRSFLRTDDAGKPYIEEEGVVARPLRYEIVKGEGTEWLCVR